MFHPDYCPIEEIQEQLSILYGTSHNCKIKLLKYSENLTYLVEDTDGEKYILRLNRPEYHDSSELDGELQWIHRLAEDTDIPLAAVIESQTRKLTEHLCFSTGERCFCSMFEYLNGTSLGNIHGRLLQYYMEEIGGITAKLHNHVCSWKDSGSLNRFSWDWKDLFGETARWGDWSNLTLLTKEQHDIVAKAVAIIEKRIAAYGKNNENYGLIHSDLNINNFLIDGTTIQVIDFDDCGYGWFLYDLACCVMMYEGQELVDATKAWIDGYEKYRVLREEDRAEIETFIVMKKIHRFSWIASHMNSDTVRNIDTAYYRNTVDCARRYQEKYCDM